MNQDDTRDGKCTYLAAAAIAAGLCVIQTTTARTVGVPTEGSRPLYVTATASTAAGEQIEVVPIALDRELRVRAAGTITAGDACEIIKTGVDAGKIATLTTGIGRFIALESGVAGDLILTRGLPASFSDLQPVPATLNATGPFAAGDFAAKLITSTTAAAVAGTMRTGTQLTAELTDVPIGGFHDISIINTGANTFTLTAATDVTIVGVAAVLTASTARFRLKRVSSIIWIAYRNGAN